MPFLFSVPDPGVLLNIMAVVVPFITIYMWKMPTDFIVLDFPV